MNSHQHQILDLLSAGPKRATDILAALHRKGSKLTIEGVYAALAGLDAEDRICIVGVNAEGQRVGSAWALPSSFGPYGDKDSGTKTVDDLMRNFARPPGPVVPGAHINRCR